jgi:hypothetical protein
METIENIISCINQQEGTSFCLEKQLGRSCFLIKDSNEKRIVKYSPSSMGTIHSLWRLLMNGSLPFQNELRILSTIICKNKKINIPNVFLLGKKFYVTEYIRHNELLNVNALNNDIKTKIVETILSLRNLEKPAQGSIIKATLFRMMESPTIRLYKDFFKIRQQYGLKSKQFFLLTIQLEWKRLMNKNKIPGSLIHNDMGINNIIIDDNDNIFIIDWEDAIWENRWSLCDIFDIALDSRNGELDKFIINNYFRLLRVTNPQISKDTLEVHFWFSYIKSLVRALSMKRICNTDKIAIKDKLNIIISQENERKNLIQKYLY